MYKRDERASPALHRAAIAQLGERQTEDLKVPARSRVSALHVPGEIPCIWAVHMGVGGGKASVSFGGVIGLDVFCVPFSCFRV